MTPPAIPVIPPVPPATPSAADTRLGAGDEFGHLFESTILRSPEDAAVRIDPDEDDGVVNGSSAGAPLEPRLGDHDGSTILGSQLAALLSAGRRPPAEVPPPPPPPMAALQLVLFNGQIVPVDQPIVLGRKPQVDRVSGNQIPRLITVTGPNNDISRSHLEIRPDPAGLLATDLGSTNGTTLIGPGGSRALTPHTPERCGAGVRFDLGDGVTIDVRAVR
jgi:hypothetical protein